MTLNEILSAVVAGVFTGVFLVLWLATWNEFQTRKKWRAWENKELWQWLRKRS